eukprot:Nk52_evm10s234 gene=Nk52_evmTU10s234
MKVEGFIESVAESRYRCYKGRSSLSKKKKSIYSRRSAVVSLFCICVLSYSTIVTPSALKFDPRYAESMSSRGGRQEEGEKQRRDVGFKFFSFGEFNLFDPPEDKADDPKTTISDLSHGQENEGHEALESAYAEKEGNEEKSNREDHEENDSNLIHVHLIPHSHDDVGWLKTTEEYYLGTNDVDHPNTCVKCILDGVTSALFENPSRSFSVVEISYFKRWWMDLLENEDEWAPVNVKSVRELIAKGQLNFVGGGMSMNDEACVHFRDAIINMEHGFEFLNEHVDIPRTKIAWHLDPFGHASAQAALFAEMGLEGFVFTRISRRDKDMRREEKRLEFNWIGSESRGEASKIFASVMNQHYNAFYPESLQNEKLKEDDELKNNGMLNSFVNLVRQFHQELATKNVLMPIGDDFSFSNRTVSSTIFHNLDVMKKYINANPSKYGMKLLYSSPAKYASAVKVDLEEAGTQLETKIGDFFPYEDGGLWTGFYSSRSSFKHQVRAASAFFRASALLISQYQLSQHRLSPYGKEEITRLGDTLGIMQHHDAVTGTAREHVVLDYKTRLNGAIADVESQVIDLANGFIFNGKLPNSGFQTCQRLNESVCEPTDDLANGQDLTMALYNPICHPRNHHVRIPIPIKEVAVFDSDMKPIVSQVIEDPSATSSNELIFTVSLRPCSLTNVIIKSTFSDITNVIQSVLTPKQPITGSKLQDGEKKLVGKGMTRLQLTKNGSNLDLSLIFNFGTPQESMVSHDYFCYQPTSRDGAYIFSPKYQSPSPIGSQKSLFVVEGPIVDEVHMVYSDEDSDTISDALYLHDRLSVISSEPEVAQLSATVGRIEGSVGGEYVVRYKTGFQSSSFYTDSMGMELLKRSRLNEMGRIKRVEDNYYPINSVLVLKSDPPKEGALAMSFAVMNDRAEGGTSMNDETAEMMLHRRAIDDDFKGLGQTLAEEDDSGKGLAITTEHVLSLGSGEEFVQTFRKHSLYISNPVMMLFTSSTEASSIVASKESQKKEGLSSLGALPDNVHLLSAKPVYCSSPTISLGKTGSKISELEGYCDSVLLKIRLYHFYAKGEHSVLSLPATVNLVELCERLSAVKVVHELELGGTKEYKNGSYVLSPENIVLQPMQIRTFLVVFESK